MPSPAAQLREPAWTPRVVRDDAAAAPRASETMIRLDGVGKRYDLFPTVAERVADAFGLLPLMFWRRGDRPSFWALKCVRLDVRRGERVGLIGRNGAGKSTLLKIISGSLTPTEGTCDIRGKVQALFELGTGFHPEFTGRQNIRAALAYQGVLGHAAADREADVIDFAELGEFIDRPLRTYSTGMYSRLAFAVATTVEPEILIIDEILGAGDGYFYGKCVERMKRLTERERTTVLFVSHDLPSVLALCDRAVWIRQGEVVADGPPLPVTRAYYADIQREENLRLQNKSDASPAAGVEASPGHDKSVVTWRVRDPRIEAVRFLDRDGQEVRGVEEGSDLTVEIGYFSSEPVAQPVFAMTIYTPDGVNICHANSFLAGTRIPQIQGRGCVRFAFQPLRVGPGEYLLGCSIFKKLDPTINSQPAYYDQHDRTHRFRVWKQLGIALNLGLVRMSYAVEHRGSS